MKVVQTMSKCTKRRLIAISMIDQWMIGLENEKIGKEKIAINEDGNTCEGESFEISKTIDIEMERKNVPCGRYITSEKMCVGNYEFEMYIYPNGGKKYEDKDENPIGMFLSMKKKPCSVESSMIFYTFSAYSNDGTKISYASCHDEFEKCKRLGFSDFIAHNKAKSLQGQIAFRLDISITKENGSVHKELNHLCGKLAKLESEFTSDINSIYSDQYMFSEAFRKSLKHQVTLYHGRIDLSSSITSFIALNVLKHLCKNFFKCIDKFRENIYRTSYATVIKGLKAVVDQKQYSGLYSLFEDIAKKVMRHHLDIAKNNHTYLLSLEEEIDPSNSFFKDTVKSIRSHVFGLVIEQGISKPSYLLDLTPTVIQKMNEEDKTLIDLQIEIFAYWKLIKMTTVHNIIRATRSEIVTKVFSKSLKACLWEEVLNFVDEGQTCSISSDEGNDFLEARENTTMEEIKKDLDLNIRKMAKKMAGEEVDSAAAVSVDVKTIENQKQMKTKSQKTEEDEAKILETAEVAAAVIAQEIGDDNDFIDEW